MGFPEAAAAEAKRAELGAAAEEGGELRPDAAAAVEAEGPQVGEGGHPREQRLG